MTKTFYVHLSILTSIIIRTLIILKALGEYNSDVAYMMRFFFKTVENILEQEANAGYFHCLLFLHFISSAVFGEKLR